jgi:hypothetical protein
MRKLIYSLFLFFSVVTIQAQDIIHLNSGSQIKAKVLEIKPNIITYKLYENIQGPTYSIYLQEVHSIAFENGYVETISHTAAPQQLNQTSVGNQSKAAPLICNKGTVKQNNVELKDEEILKLLQTNQQALDYYTKGKKYEQIDKMLANVSLGVVGGVAAFTTASVYRSKGRSYIQQAVDIYNTGLQQ